MRDELLGSVGLDGRDGAKEVDKAGSVRARAEEEVEATSLEKNDILFET